MEYISLIVNEDAAHDCLADLGKLGVIQFTDVSFLTVGAVALFQFN
jgi:V-type H+-transporting ATPase subunit a